MRVLTDPVSWYLDTARLSSTLSSDRWDLAEVWMLLDFIISVIKDIQHRVSSIQNLPSKRNRLTHIGNAK